MRLFLYACVFAVATGSALAQSVSDATNIDTRWNRSWPAGPFSQVSTSWGILQTSVPICGVEGPGGTSIGASIYHRSNQDASTQYGIHDGGVGRGWYLSLSQTCQSGNGGVTWFQGGNNTAAFQLVSVVNGVPTYARRPGTRADMSAYMVGGQIRGWDVTTQDDKTVYKFRQEVVGQVAYRLSQIVDAHGNTVNFTYDADDRPTRMTDASGVRYIEVVYTTNLGNEQVSYITLNYPGGSRRWDFVYTNNYLTRIDYPAPVTGGARPNARFAYTTNSSIEDAYDLKGYRWHYVYGVVFSPYRGVTAVHPPYLPNPTSQWDATGTGFAWSTYTSGPATDWTKTCTVTDRRGWNWKHVYYNNGGNDWFSNPIKQTFDGGLLSSDLYTWDYNKATVTSHTDRRGNAASFTYDARYNMLTKTDREGQLWRWIYNSDKPVTQIDPTGNRTIHSYNATWDLESTTVDPKTDPFDGTYSKPTGIALKTNFTYTATGELASQWSGTDTPVQYSNFDAYGNARTVTSPAGNGTTFTFDELNNKLSATEPLPGGTTNFSYDNWNRQLRTTFPGGSYTEKSYDDNGNVASVRDANGHTSTMAYDAYNRLTGTTQPVDAVTANNILVSYGYDLDSNRTSVTNGRGKVTTYTFNSRNQLTQITYPDTTTRKFTYDGNNNRLTRIDGQNRTTTYGYDKENRLTTSDYPGTTEDTTNYWRIDGLRDRFTDPTGTTQHTYNGAKQLVSVYQPVPNKTLTYTYDTGGRRKTMAVGSMTWTLNYDSGLRLDTVNQTLGAATPVNYDYNPNDSVSLRTLGSGHKTVFDYDVRGRVNYLSHQTSAGLEQQRLDYTYDDNGNILTYRDNTIGGNNWYTAHGYDWADRLLTEVRTGGSSFNFNNSYAYDKNGNRASVTRNGSSSTYVVDNNDRLTSGDGFTFNSYSADGNPGSVVSGGVTKTFTYSYENRVKTLAYSTGGSDSYKYNADGQRVEKVENGVTTRFVYDGSTVIAETNSSGTILSYFLTGVGFVAGTSQYYYRDNALGSNLATTNATGTVDSRTEYDAYGVEYNVQSGTKSQFKFAGKHGYYTDDRSGLQLLGARYYMPTLGRFLTQDPIGHEAGLNLYAYCANNPLIRIDPDGLSALDISGIFTSVFKALGRTKDFGYTMDGAAKTAIRNAISSSVSSNIEAAGVIYRMENGRYMYTNPNDSRNAAFFSFPGNAPSWGKRAGFWHTHPSHGIITNLPNVDLSDAPGGRFSDGDMDMYDGLARTYNAAREFTGFKFIGPSIGYLGTYDGRILRYKPAVSFIFGVPHKGRVESIGRWK